MNAKEMIDALKAGPVAALPVVSGGRTKITGAAHEVSEGDYWYYLEVLPPRFMRHGAFGFGEGADDLRLFWKADGRFFCRQLTAAESEELCAALGIPLST